MRDLIVAFLITATLPTCFRRPFIGLLVFTLLAYMRVQDLTWGWARFQRWSYFVALATIAGYVLGSGNKRRFILPDMRCWIMILLAFWVGLSIAFSRYLHPSDFTGYIEYLKIVGVALFTTAVVINRAYLRILLWVIALSFGFYGVKSGLQFILSGGGLKIIEGPGGMLSDNNDFALALCMGIPFLLHLGLAEKRVLLRRVTLAMVPLTVMTVIATHSRGAALSMGAMTCVLVWRSRNRVAGFALMLLMLIAGVMMAPKSYVERLSTIKTYQADGSARGRLEAWAVAWNMVKDRPMLGVGFAKFQQNYKAYDTRHSTDVDGIHDPAGTKVAHNSYFQIAAECGVPALLMYLALMGLSFRDIWKIRAEASRRYHSSWILSYATMFEASLVAFMVGSFFLNRAHFDLFYHFVAIVVVFGKVARESMADETITPVVSGERGTLSLIRQRTFGRVARASGFGRRPEPRGGFGKAS